jgi:Mg2+ and Co2+ transporter CorA
MTLEPLLLPQALTVSAGCTVAALRWANDSTDITLDSVQELTNRVAVIILHRIGTVAEDAAQGWGCSGPPPRIITVHKSYMPIIDGLIRTLQTLAPSIIVAGRHKAKSKATPATTSASAAAAVSSDTAAAAAASTSSVDSSVTPPPPMGSDEFSRIHHLFVCLMVRECCKTFNVALARSVVLFDQLEANLFKTTVKRSVLSRNIYHIKRRAAVFARTLALTHEALTHLQQVNSTGEDVAAAAVVPPDRGLSVSELSSRPPRARSSNRTHRPERAKVVSTPLQISLNAVQQDVHQLLQHIRSLAEELNENASTVLQLQFQLSSYQLNELMRVLTIFSAMFIPLGFIASFYGMNFETLPLLNDEDGLLYCVMLMAVVAASLASWFRYKKFV